MVEGKVVKALVDTGCMTSIVHSRVVGRCSGESCVVAFDGSVVHCQGRRKLRITIGDVNVDVNAVVSDSVFGDVSLVIGMDVIEQMGGVTVCKGTVACSTTTADNVEMSTKHPREAVEVIRDVDFDAEFDGSVWTVEWKWKAGAPVLRNRVSDYNKKVDAETREKFDREVEKWIEEGILVPWHEQIKEGIIPLMAVIQPTKEKVRPVLDFRELNNHVSCRTGDNVADVCSDVLRDWRGMGGGIIADLKAAYLQIRVSERLWKYQLVNYKGKTYCLTRLGFGLNSAPRIMAKILKTVLSKTTSIDGATSSYIDDILVNEEGITAGELVEYLGSYGLIAKTPEMLDGGSALGLRLSMDDRGDLIFSRSNEIPESVTGINKRTLFSICGKLVGHYPVAGWLRIACSFIKRMANENSWNDKVSDQELAMLQDVLNRVKKEDPMKGKWHVPQITKGTVWCNASSIALSALLEIDGEVVEDAAWLRKKNDFNHINVAELESVMKGINMAVRWGLTDIDIFTDSATVCRWLKTVLAEEKRVQTKGAAELLVKRHLDILQSSIEEFKLWVTITLVHTSKNKADVLTRVKKEWMNVEVVHPGHREVVVCATGCPDLKTLHEMHHMGVDRMLYLAKKVFPNVSLEDVQKIVQACEQCQSIDPAPSSHESGQLSVFENWRRLAVNVTHHHQVPYLSIVDCGPGRFTVWKKLRRETAEFVVEALNEMFMERGPVYEILMDNGTSFRSKLMSELLARWQVKALFRAAYRPSGNGIVERHHRTVKAIAERGNISPLEAVYWYNLTPRNAMREDSVPHQALYQYEWREIFANVEEDERAGSGAFKIGDDVWIKPPSNQCTTKWKKGKVTAINSVNNVDVDGMPRHILDIRRVVEMNNLDGNSEEDGNESMSNDEAIGVAEAMCENNVVEENEADHEEDGPDGPVRVSTRVRRPPVWTSNCVGIVAPTIDERECPTPVKCK